MSNNNNTSSITSNNPIKALTEANTKYKNLLKLAKQRIENHETEIQKLKTQLSEATTTNTKNNSNNNNRKEGVIISIKIVIKQGPNTQRLWALCELETKPLSDEVLFHTNNEQDPYEEWEEWKEFENLSELKLYCEEYKCDGPPIDIPEFSLSSKESIEIQNKCGKQVDEIQEEFRRYRVRAEVARKQADAALKAAQAKNLADNNSNHSNNRSSISRDKSNQLSNHHLADNLKKELMERDREWKMAYEELQRENESLKNQSYNSSAEENVLANQWRQRYEDCEGEKDALIAKLELSQEQAKEMVAETQTKYKQLKDEYKLYRKKAKEIFDAQNRGDTSLETIKNNNSSNATTSGDEARLEYLKSLMVNYLSSTGEAKDHMERAIGTVLKFDNKEKERIEKFKAENNPYNINEYVGDSMGELVKSTMGTFWSS